MDFSNTYRNSPDRLQMKCPDAIIQNNDKLKIEFLAFHADHETEAIHITNMNYAHKPKLPDMKDEMRKAGLG